MIAIGYCLQKMYELRNIKGWSNKVLPIVLASFPCQLKQYISGLHSGSFDPYFFAFSQREYWPRFLSDLAFKLHSDIYSVVSNIYSLQIWKNQDYRRGLGCLILILNRNNWHYQIGRMLIWDLGCFFIKVRRSRNDFFK